MTRPTIAYIDLEAIKHNLAFIKEKAGPGARIIPVVKADAYGHGSAQVSMELVSLGVGCLAVAYLEEALELKDAGLKADVIILGPMRKDEIKEIVHEKFIPVLSSPDDFAVIEHGLKDSAETLKAIVDVDTGMGRMGFMPEEVGELEKQLARFPSLKVAGIFSHFPVSESGNEDDREFTKRQLQDFKLIARGFARTCPEAEYHGIANSGGIMFHDDSSMTAVRPGIALYGVSPDPEDRKSELVPVMRWVTEIAQVRTLPKGACISYGRATVLERESRIALLPVGYADGLQRKIRPGFELMVRGRPAPIAGVVTMDFTMLDVTDLPGAAVGDPVLILGRDPRSGVEIGAHKHARAAGTIAYEILTSVGKRVRRVYMRGEDKA